MTWSPTSSPPARSAAVEQGKEVDPEDVETAIENYRALYEFLIEDRAARNVTSSGSAEGLGWWGNDAG